MHSDNNPTRMLVIPALRAIMGDWIYYIAFMRMRDLAKRVNVAQEIHDSKVLNELIQRELTNRAPNIREYLLSQPQRFFNSIVIGVYEGSPRWYELDIHRNEYVDPEDWPEYIEGALGILTLEGSEKLFAIDGQHRIIGIREAVAANENLEDEEISTIFVAHSNDPEGLQRTRRLFTTLNRYAKPVSKSEIIALDEDDTVAIVTRQLVEKYPLFTDGKISLRTRNIHPTDQSSFTTIVTLYTALDVYLRDRKYWKKFKRERPSDEVIESYYSRAVHLWDTLSKHLKPLQEVKDASPSDNIASKYRNNQVGGHLLFRPVGLRLVIEAIRLLTDKENSVDEVMERISRVPMELSGPPWVGLLWDDINNRMITTPENRKASVTLLRYAVGDNRVKSEEIRTTLAGLLNKEPDQITLKQYV